MGDEMIQSVAELEKKPVESLRDEEIKLSNKKLLIDLINTETAQAESERKREGWTSWALLGALATVVWLLIGQISQGNLDWQYIGFVFITLTLIIEFLRPLPSIFNVRTENLPREPRFFYTSFLAFQRFSYIAMLFQAVVLLYISYSSRVAVPSLAVVSARIVFFYIIVGVIIILVISCLKFPMKSYVRGWLGRLLTVLPVVLLGVSSYGYVSSLLNNLNSIEPINLKTATSLTFIFYILTLLVGLPKTSPLTYSLTSIRRELALDKLDVSMAARQIDVALSGMRVEDLLQEYVKKILDNHNTINDLLNRMILTFRAIRDLIPSTPSDLRKEEFKSRAEAIKALEQSKKDNAARLDAAEKELISSEKAYFDKVNQIAGIDSRAIKDINEVNATINIAREESAKLYSEEKEQIRLLEAHLDALMKS